YAWEIPTMFFLNISNPGSVLALLAMYAGVVSFLHVETMLEAMTVVAAFMGGSFLYWFLVSDWIAGARHRFDKVQLGRINPVAGLVLIGFGVLLVGESILRWLALWAIGQLFGD